MDISSQPTLGMDAYIAGITSDLSKGDVEDKKATKAQIRSNTDHLKDQRQSRIKNLLKQMHGVSAGGGCINVIKPLAKITSFITQPLSMLTLGKLKMDLGKTLDILVEANKQGKLMGLKIDGQQIQKTIEDFKSLLGNDMDDLKNQETISDKETQRIMTILDDIQKSFDSTNGVGTGDM